MKPTVLIVGEQDQSEFTHILEWLRDRSLLSAVRSITDAIRQASDIPSPQCVVLLQARPGQILAAEVELLHRAWPLARLVMLLGSWCEGEMRSGKPCPGVWRIYWYDFVRRMEPIFGGGKKYATSWSLPRLATDLERLTSDLMIHPPQLQGSIAISANPKVAYDVLAEACRMLNFEPRPVAPPEPATSMRPVAGIWDVRLGDDAEWTAIQQFAQSIGSGRVVLIRGFPRSDDYDRACKSGLILLAKPFQLPDLWRALSGVGTIDESLASRPRCA